MLDFIKRHKIAVVILVVLLVILAASSGDEDRQPAPTGGTETPRSTPGTRATATASPTTKPDQRAGATPTPAPVQTPSQASTTFSWQRHGDNPVLAPERVRALSGGQAFSMADPALLWDEGKFKMWFGYGALDRPGDSESLRLRVGYAESRNGKSWEAMGPVLEVGTGWDKTNVETPSVLKDDSVPDGHPRKYRMYYAGLDHAVEGDFAKLLEAGMGYGIGLAFSADGKRFTKLPASESPYRQEGLVLKPDELKTDRDVWDFANVADPQVIKKDGQWHLWYTSIQHKANAENTTGAIAYATSSDGIHWTKHGPVLQAALDWEKMRKDPGMGRPYVLWNNNRFEMFYDATREDTSNPLDNTSAGVGFAWSTDGRTWHKNAQPTLTTNNGKGEKRGIMIGVAALVKDGTYHLFYPGADPDHNHFVINLATGVLR